MWSGATGRYQARCGEGHCALTGRKATSKIQGRIFTLLDFVLGNGELDKADHIFGRQVYLDMVFRLPSGRLLVVEHDGARWHEGREAQDAEKAEMVESWHAGCVVVRIREAPLTVLRPPDVQVPARSDAATCARLVLIHLLDCLLLPEFGDRLNDVTAFFQASAHPLKYSDIRCAGCLRYVKYYSKILPPSLSPQE